MTDNQWFRGAVLSLKADKKLTQRDIAGELGITDRYLSGVLNDRLPLTESLIHLFAEKFHIKPGECSTKVKNDGALVNEESIPYIRVLPVSAIGSSLNDFLMNIDNSEGERMISPIRDFDAILTITDEDTGNKYPIGTRIWIKRIDDKAFIAWGRVYVIDTCNGVFIVRLYESEKEGCLHCVYLNSDQDKYPPFDIPNNKDVIHEIFRVLPVALFLG